MNQLTGAAGAAQEAWLGAHAVAAARRRVLRRLAELAHLRRLARRRHEQAGRREI